MLIRPISDIHINIKSNYGYTPSKLETDIDTVLIIAGDIGTPYLFKEWVSGFHHRFKSVIAILGNHDYYRMTIERAPSKWKEAVESLDNVHIMHNNFIDMEGIRIVGGTLWTNLGTLNPTELNTIKRHMNEYKKVRAGAGYSKITTNVILREFMTTWNTIKDAVNSADGLSTVAVVHHSPFKESVLPEFSNDDCKWAYVSDMADDLLGMARVPDIIIHGHLHRHMDYNIGDTRVIANPRGHLRPEKVKNPKEYFEETGFIDDMLIDFSTMPPVLER